MAQIDPEQRWGNSGKRGLTSADLGAPTIIRGTADHFKERIRGAAAVIVILGRCEYPFEYSRNQSSL
jgi:hypothetical protein